MSKLQLRAWQRGGMIALLLSMGLLLSAASAGRSDDAPKAKADDKAKDERAKSDDKKPEAPPAEPVVGPPSGGHAATDLINKELVKFWAANKVKPSRPASDYEFVRRVYLDVIGRVPAAWEVKQYIADSDRKTKRARLITRLLTDKFYKEDLENYWADVWTTLLLTRSGNKDYHAQMEDWLADQFGKNAPWDQMVRSLLTATGKTGENNAVNFVLAHLGEPQRDRAEEGQFDAVPITSRSIRLFLGYQVQCTQCHDHPFNTEWKQAQFWGINAFFRQVERGGQPNMRQQRNQPAAELTLKDNASYNFDKVSGAPLVFYENRQAIVKSTLPRFLDGRNLPKDGKKSRREVLADFIVDHDNFPKAMVNRMWGHFFGRGLCQQAVVDDFNEQNPVIHPEILDGVAKQFKDYRFNLRELISWICNSEAYALSCEANATNNKKDQEVYFSRMLLKNMSPEQLFDSLKTALDQPMEMRKIATRKPGAPRVVDEARKKKREEWMERLTRNFGDDEGNEMTFNGTVVQALLLMNGRDVQEELTRKDNNTVLNAMKKNSTGAIENELWLAALGRLPTARERELVTVEAKKTGANAQLFWEDVLWTLLNSNEFVLNH
jgi:Protein of unknown function (DUF1549)/Protein of unknown function (DUF1553)